MAIMISSNLENFEFKWASIYNRTWNDYHPNERNPGKASRHYDSQLSSFLGPS